MLYVPAGSFTMGCSLEETNLGLELCKKYRGDLAFVTCQSTSFTDERPAHTVTLDAFWIDRTEVSNGQYQRCVKAGVCDPPVESGSYTRDTYYGDSTYDDYPVVWVTWQQAADYCAWTGGRLPTEAEWEYAARGPEGRIFPWGNTFDGTRGNYCDASCAAGISDPAVKDGYPDTAPVGSFPTGASWCGALDMAGNVREWVADWFSYYKAEPQINPTGPASGKSRIPRGGCWLDTPVNLRTTNRGQNTPDYTRHKVGFRCVTSLAPVQDR
jgi:formylglycine-generating enzyme required for sulfatase activity